MNRVWLVTGANSGFGRAVTEAAVAAGDVAVATARRVAALDDLAAAHPGQVDVLPLDVTDRAAVDAAVHDVIARHGRIDVLVNNAGRSHVGAADDAVDAIFTHLDRTRADLTAWEKVARHPPARLAGGPAATAPGWLRQRAAYRPVPLS